MRHGVVGAVAVAASCWRWCRTCSVGQGAARRQLSRDHGAVHLDPGGGRRRPAGGHGSCRPRRLQGTGGPPAPPRAAARQTPAGVVITKPRLTLRGMNRNSGHHRRHQAGLADVQRKRAAAQDFGPRATARAAGPQRRLRLEGEQRVRSRTSPSATSSTGSPATTATRVWWNGGDEAGGIGGWGFIGSYLIGDEHLLRR